MSKEQLKDLISKEYYNEDNAFSADLIYKKLKPDYPTLTKKLVAETIKEQQSAQVFARKLSKSKYHLAIPKAPFGRCQIDLLDLSNMQPNKNKGMSWLFVFIDSYTKLAFVEAMKKKDTTECVSALRKILSEIWEEYHETVFSIDLDDEKAFLSKPFQKLCEENDIHLNFVRKEDSRSKSFVEAFNRTIRQKIQKYKASQNRLDWVNSIPKMIKAYNKTTHSALKRSPEEAVKDNPYLDKQIDEQAKQRKPAPLKIGQRVRVLLNRDTFTKGTERRWSSDIHTIERIHLGNKYYVSGRVEYYKDYELLPVDKVREKPPEEEDVEVEKEEKKHKIERRVARR